MSSFKALATDVRSQQYIVTRNAHLRSRWLPLNFPHPCLKAQTRQASHASQGQANRSSRGSGKALGLKRAATELVVPGTIIFRQRGTLWFPGENCGMGRDRSIYAKEKGYVTFYKAPWNGIGYGGRGRIKGDVPGKDFKKFIGIVIKQGDTLPRPEGAPRSRRLGMEKKIRRNFSTENNSVTSPAPSNPTEAGLIQTQGKIRQQEKSTRAQLPHSKMTEGYQFRESNSSIGRIGDKARDEEKVARAKTRAK